MHSFNFNAAENDATNPFICEWLYKTNVTFMLCCLLIRINKKAL